MIAGELFDSLLARGVAREAEPRAGALRSVVVGGVELAIAGQPSERNMRARWRERVGSTGTPYLLIADRSERQGSVVVLGLSSADAPIRVVSAEGLAGVLESAAQLDPLEAARFVVGEIDRLDQTGITGVKLKGLLTVHTLDVRLRGDSTRWGEAAASVVLIPDFARYVMPKVDEAEFIAVRLVQTRACFISCAAPGASGI